MLEVVVDPVLCEEVAEVGQEGGVAGYHADIAGVTLVPATGVRQLIQPRYRVFLVYCRVFLKNIIKTPCRK